MKPDSLTKLPRPALAITALFLAVLAASLAPWVARGHIRYYEKNKTTSNDQ